MSPTDTVNALPAGYTLLEYRIEAMLGVGGFGLTYLAHDANLNTKVAIKEYLPSDFALRGEDQSVRPRTASLQQSFEWGLQRFLDESRTLASFRHPNIVRVMRFFEANHTGYMVMEFIAGKPLNEWSKQQGQLDQAAVTRLVGPILDGLEVMHATGYIHRDIKPQNIFIKDDGTPILIDFGSARLKVNPNQELTAVVTPGFSPLEQYHSQGKQGAWTDIYALAGVLYWLATGSKPVEAAARAREDLMPSALECGERKYYSAKFLLAIDWGLKPYEDARPQSIAEWRAALLDLAAGLHPRTMPLGAPALKPAPATPAPLAAPPPLPTPAAASAPAASSVSRVHSQNSGLLNSGLLKEITTELAVHLGPIATLIVKNAAKNAPSIPALAGLLAPDIADERARTRFVKKFSKDDAMPNSHVQSGLATPADAEQASVLLTESTLQRFSVETLRRAELALSQYIGAVARVVVKRAAVKARDESELYLLLADEIRDKTEKKTFIRKAISVSGGEQPQI